MVGLGLSLVAACGGAQLPYTSADLQRDARLAAGKALVRYLGQDGADTAVCAADANLLVDFGVRDFATFVEGLEDGDVPPGRWTGCATRLLAGLEGARLRAAVEELTERFASSLEVQDDDVPQLLLLNALAVVLDTRPSGSGASAKVIAEIGGALAGHELGSQARALAGHVHEGLEMSRGRYRGTLVTEERLATITDTQLLRRFARHLPTPTDRRAARVRFVELAIAASASDWVRTHAEETKARVLATGRNALDLRTIPITEARYVANPPGGTAVVEQDVGEQTARLLLRLLDETSLLPNVDLRERLQFTLAGVGSVTLCGPADAFDVTPCVDSAALELASPLAALDHDGVLHLRDGLSPAELGTLLEQGQQLVVPVLLGITTLTKLEWPLRLLPPEPLEYEQGEPLAATIERLGARIALTFQTPDSPTLLAFVEASDPGEFAITTRGRSGYRGRDGSAGSSGWDGTDGSSASCPSTSGGNGGNGGDGGRGGDGADGGPGGDGGDIALTLLCDAGCDDLERSARQLLRTEGGRGGAGGTGGAGGRGGRGGRGGSGTTCTSSSGTTHLSSGRDGSSGSNGARGSDGWHGPAGSPGRIDVQVRRPSR